MIEDIFHLIASQISGIMNVAFSIVAVASAIAAMTKTPNDDEIVGKAYQIIDLLALNIGHAKEGAVKPKGGRFVAD